MELGTRVINVPFETSLSCKWNWNARNKAPQFLNPQCFFTIKYNFKNLPFDFIYFFLLLQRFTILIFFPVENN